MIPRFDRLETRLVLSTALPAEMLVAFAPTDPLDVPPPAPSDMPVTNLIENPNAEIEAIERDIRERMIEQHRRELIDTLRDQVNDPAPTSPVTIPDFPPPAPAVAPEPGWIESISDFVEVSLRALDEALFDASDAMVPPLMLTP